MKAIPLLVSARDYSYFCATRTLMRKGAPCSGPAPVKCLLCAGDYYGAPKGWITAVGVALSRPLLVRKMSGLHSISAYVDDVTRRFLLGSASPGENGLVELLIRARSVLVLSAAFGVLLYVILRTQTLHPWNPRNLEPLEPWNPWNP